MRGRWAHIPTAKVEHDEKFPRVAKGVYSFGKSNVQQQQARRFLESVGVRELGEPEEVEAILQKRYQHNDFDPSMADLPRWVALVETHPETARLFRNHFIFKRADGKWGTPSQVFLDKPFIETEMSVYFDAVRSAKGTADDGIPQALAAEYEECAVGVERLVSFAKVVGARAGLQSINDLLPILSHVEKTIEAGKADIGVIRFIWCRLCQYGSSNNHCLENPHQRHKGFGYYETNYQPSPLSYRLRMLSWVPQESEVRLTFVQPAQASRDLLPDGFAYDSGWYWVRMLGFGEQAAKRVEEQQEKERAATSMGFPDAKSLDRARRFAALPAEEQEIILAQREKSNELPTKNRLIRNDEMNGSNKRPKMLPAATKKSGCAASRSAWETSKTIASNTSATSTLLQTA